MKSQETDVYHNSEGSNIEFVAKPVDDLDYLLYYGPSRLTDKYYINNVAVAVNNKFITSGTCKCWVRGKIRKGDCLTTCRIYGVAIMNKSPILSFGRCLTNKPYESIGLVEFEFC